MQKNSAVLTVPDNALQWDRGTYHVFVRLDERTYDPRVALPGAREGGRTELLDARVLLGASLAGSFSSSLGPLPALAAVPMTRRVLREVRPGEHVVTTGSHVLKNELFKSRIGSED